MKHSKLRKSVWTAKTSDESLKTAVSYRRISRSLAYRIYSYSLVTGKFIIVIFSMLSRVLENLWHLTLSDVFSKMYDFFRNLTELKRTRFIRGNFSITRGIFNIAINTLSAFKFVANAFFSKGLRFGFRVIYNLFKDNVSDFWSKRRRLLNYLAPVAGMAVLALTIYAWSKLTIAVSVSYNNKVLGVVSSEQVFTDAANNVETKVSQASGVGFSLNKSPVYKLEITNKSDLLSKDELYDGILSASSKDVQSGYGLYVDNNLVGSNTDNTAIQTMLDNIIAPYKANESFGKVSFYEDVEIKKGVFPKSVERTTDNMKAVLTATAKNSQTYTAQKGDSPAMIANMFHISVDQLYAMNTSVQPDSLSQGETIQVVNTQPTIMVQYMRRQDSTQSIPFQTVSQQDNSLAKGRTKVTQQGQAGVMQLTSDVTYVGNTVVDSQTITTAVLKSPVNKFQLVGTFDYTAQASNLVDYAEHFGGSRYVKNAEGPYSFDCSGFTKFVFDKLGVTLPHNAAEQSHYGTYVSKGNLQPGDLVFFNTFGYGISHVGIYIGGGKIINALNSRTGVIYTTIDSGWGSSEYVTARRVW